MQELKFDSENDVHFLDAVPKSVDVGNYDFVFEVIEYKICIFFFSSLARVPNEPDVHLLSMFFFLGTSKSHLSMLHPLFSIPFFLLDCST